ncbi:MAG: glycosyltransferase family 4 protein [Lachnospiraceae bacterium]|nr:glycosyltransferase family 4 protein [Lachnospiraceae bacterium]
MKRIAFFSGDITRGGGTERVGTLVANALSKEAGYQIYFISLTHNAPEPAYEISPEITRSCFSKKWINPGPGYLPVIFKLIRYIHRNKINILIDIDGVLDILSIPAKWITKVKLVSWEHFYFYNEMGTSYRKIIRKMAARYADAIVTLTEQDKGFYQENLKIRGRIQAIHNPADYMQPQNDVPERNYENKIILSVGRLCEAKAFERIPQIAAGIKNNYPGLSFQWLIAGEGELRAQIEEQIRRWDVEKEVTLLGHVSELGALYGKALVYVMTSRYEGLPMVLLEAKMHRLPCVSFDIMTGPSEIIQDGIDGYLVGSPENESCAAEKMVHDIAKLLTDHELYQNFSNHTQDNLGAFRMDAVISCWKELLEQL